MRKLISCRMRQNRMWRGSDRSLSGEGLYITLCGMAGNTALKHKLTVAKNWSAEEIFPHNSFVIYRLLQWLNFTVNFYVLFIFQKTAAGNDYTETGNLSSNGGGISHWIGVGTVLDRKLGQIKDLFHDRGTLRYNIITTVKKGAVSRPIPGTVRIQTHFHGISVQDQL